MEYAANAGGELMLKPRGGPKVRIRLSQVQPGSSFTDVTRFPLARMIDVHELQDTPQGLRLKNTIRMEGPLAWLWRSDAAFAGACCSGPRSAVLSCSAPGLAS